MFVDHNIETMHGMYKNTVIVFLYIDIYDILLYFWEDWPTPSKCEVYYIKFKVTANPI